MNTIQICLFCGLVFWLYLTLVTCQEASIWEAELTEACGNTTDIDCVDKHMSEIFSNLTRLYNPDGGYSNLSYLDHHHYGPKDRVETNVTLEEILKLSPTKYNQSEIDIIKAFPLSSTVL